MLKHLRNELKECSDDEPIRKMLLLKKIKEYKKPVEIKSIRSIKRPASAVVKSVEGLDKLLEINDDVASDKLGSVADEDNMDMGGDGVVDHKPSVKMADELFTKPRDITDNKYTKQVETDYINNKLKDRLFSESVYKGQRLKKCEKPFSNDKALF